MRAEGFKARQPELVVQVPPISSSFNHNVTLHLPQLMGPPETVHFSQVYQDHCHSLLTLIRKGDFGKLNQEVNDFFFFFFFFFLFFFFFFFDSLILFFSLILWSPDFSFVFNPIFFIYFFCIQCLGFGKTIKFQFFSFF